MTSINQLDYETIVYPTTLSPDVSLHPPYPSVAQAGCGLCCSIMLLDFLRQTTVSMEDMITLTVTSMANQNGTDMVRLASALCQQYKLTINTTDSLQTLIDGLNRGGAAILNVGGSSKERVGTFSQAGHYILATNTVQSYIQIFDPSFSTEKYSHPDRIPRIKLCKDTSLLVKPAVLAEDLMLRSPSIYLFEKIAISV